MNYLETRYMKLRTVRYLIIFFVAVFVDSGTIFAQKKEADTLEEIGKHLSELLVNRKNISDSHFAINVERLFPDKDFSKYEDSPAEFILAMLYGSQLILPETWADLLLQADSLNINKHAKYLKTYFMQRTKDSFILTCVLKQSTKYYAFSLIVLGWNNNRYVMRIYKEMKEFKSIKELKKNPFSIVMEEDLKEIQEIETDME